MSPEVKDVARTPNAAEVEDPNPSIAPAHAAAQPPAVCDTPEYILPSALFKTPGFPTPEGSIAADSPADTPASRQSSPGPRTPASRPSAQKQARQAHLAKSSGTPSLKKLCLKNKKKGAFLLLSGLFLGPHRLMARNNVSLLNFSQCQVGQEPVLNVQGTVQKNVHAYS